MEQADQTVELTYSISGRLLNGRVLGEDFSVAAVSGGGANAQRSDGDLSNNPDLTMVKSQRLSHAVGRLRPNRPEDVRIVQRMLNDAMAPSPNLVCDGRYGPRTAAAIERFQSSMGFRQPDGWIAPDGETFRLLIQKSRHYSYTKYVFSPAVITPDSASTGDVEYTHVSHRGGPLPVGSYLLHVSALTPPGRISLRALFPTNRTGLQIHGSGPVGSDGCIVIEDVNALRRLRQAVQEVAPGKARLEVLR